MNLPPIPSREENDQAAAKRKAFKRSHKDLLEALIDATDNCLWRSDSEIPLSEQESQRIYNKAMAAIAKAKQITN